MSENREIEVTPTGPYTADVSPVVVREGVRTRMVFKPSLVDNQTDKHASVRGTLTYQSKHKADPWADVDTLPLNKVKAGENLRFELSSSELLKLFQCLSALYGYMEKEGFRYGRKRLVVVDEEPSVRDFLDVMKRLDDPRSALAILDWLTNRSAAATADILRDADGELVSHLAVATGLSRLRSFVAEAEAMLDSSDEKSWQKLLARNSWTLGQIYSCPLVILQREVYLGGKNTANKGGNVADFLYRNHLTDNAVIVEIKTPRTALTGEKTYRNNAYAPSPEMAGAVQQILQDLYTLRSDYKSLHGDRVPDFRIFAPRLLLIIGNISKEKEADIDRVRSFELFRKELREIDVVTFDELVDKARQMLNIFETA
ncbi:Shedu immune nuclease family protein [Lentzea atacamensis]|nr:Shedu immune nuclease family protein [Lentzea atacamensis]